MRFLQFLLVGLLISGVMVGCASSEVSESDAKAFGQESEADRAAKASGADNSDPGRD